MEKPLEKLLDEVMNTPGVTGVICADSHGLCLSAKGAAKRDSAGLISAIESQSRKLCPEAKDNPVVCVESDAGNIVIKAHEGVTMGIYKGTS